MVNLVKDGRVRSLEIANVDGGPVRGSAVVEQLEAAGFQWGYRGLTYRL